MTNNIEERVGKLEVKVSYLESGHNELKIMLKGLEGIPYQMKGVSEKLDTVIEQQKELKKEVKEEIDTIEERIDCLEEEQSKPNDIPKFLGLDRDKVLDIIKWALTVLITLLMIVAQFYGVDVSPVISSGGL